MAANTFSASLRPGRESRPDRSKFFSRFLIYFVLTLGLSFTLLPFMMMILSSFKTNLEVLRVPPTFWPENFTLENYTKIFNDPKLPLLRFYGNSAFVAVFNVVSTLFTSSLIGYMFAKFEFPGKHTALWLVPDHDDDPQPDHHDPQLPDPGQAWVDQLAVGTGHLQRGGCLWHLHAAPVLRDAAQRTAGCRPHRWRQRMADLSWRIVLPQLGAPLATLGILGFMHSWNAYLWPMIVLQKIEVRTLPIILTWFNSTHTGQGALVMAATVLIILPILIVFMFFQRWIVQGFTMSGFK